MMRSVNERKFTNFSPIDWQSVVKRAPALGSLLLKVTYLRNGGLTYGWYTAVYRYAKFVVALLATQGRPGTVKYLKACSTMLQQGLGRQVIDNPRDLGSAVTRTGGGLPRVIPSIHRKMIRSGDAWTFRLWLTFFWVYRVIEYPGKAKLHTITTPNQWDLPLVIGFASFMRRFMPVLLSLVNPALVKPWLESVAKHEPFYPPWTERNFDQIVDAAKRSRQVEFVCNFILPGKPDGWVGWILDFPVFSRTILKSSSSSGTPEESKPFSRTITSVGALLTDYLVLTDPHESGGTTVMGYLRDYYKLYKGRRTPKESDFRQFQKDAAAACKAAAESPDHYLDGYAVLRRSDSKPLAGFAAARGVGWLGLKEEPAGKVRVFAMVDNLTQTMLYPLHKAIFAILEKIPQDGTKDQHRPAKTLAKDYGPRFWSFDLSAATDRFPVDVEQVVVSAIFGHSLGGLWRNILTDRVYRTPVSDLLGNSSPLELRYGAGQPMGALTSWGSFALAHHILVQYAAYKVYRRLQWFTAYALLGDDIVLADGRVAEIYLRLLNTMGVEINLSKSLVSSNGVFEFAKRTYRHQEDVSGFSLEAVGQCITNPSVLESVLEMAHVRGLHRALLISAQILGYGFKTRSRLSSVIKSRSRLQGLALLLSRPKSLYGLTPEQWFLQGTVGRPALVSQGRMLAVQDAVRQSLLASLSRAFEGLRRFYITGGDRKISIKYWFIPETWFEHISELELFLSRYVMKTFSMELRENFPKLEVTYAETVEALSGESTIQESWTLVEDLLTEISSYSQDLDIMTRPIAEDRRVKPEERRIMRTRSRLLQAWRKIHQLVISSNNYD